MGDTEGMKNTSDAKPYTRPNRTRADRSYYLVGEYVQKPAYRTSLLHIAKDLTKENPKYKIFLVKEIKK